MIKSAKKSIEDLTKQLNTNIEKKNKVLNLIEKCQKKVDLLNKQIEEKGITYELFSRTNYEEMVKMFSNEEELNNYYWNVLCKHNSLEEQIKNNNRKIKDLDQIISNLNQKIENNQEEERKYLNAPQVIKDFCEKWRVDATFYFITHHDNSKSDPFRYRDEEYIKRSIADEAKMRALQICYKVWDKCGEIVDASGLHWGNDCSLNGQIIGTRGIAYVETIIAGGYNIQCEHFRVLVK